MNTTSNKTVRMIDKFVGLIELPPPGDRFVLRVLFFVMIFSGIWLLYDINESHTEKTPIHGGVLQEGIIGTPRFVNPVLANTRADHDVTTLLYSGLLRTDSTGMLVPDLAESITVSEDGLTYNIVLRNDIYFHDGEPINASDVIYTIQLIQDPDLKSPLRGNWTNVITEELGDQELNVILDEAYAPFLENFLVGIMPEHLWGDLPIEQLPFSQLNTEPIGSGPFLVTEAHRDASGLIDGYTLSAFRVNPQSPNIDTLELTFFNDEEDLIEAIEAGTIDASAYISNSNLAMVLENDNLRLESEPLPRVFAIFLNPNRSSALRDDAAREALSIAIDREALIEATLFGQGVPITSPIITASSTVESGEGSETTTTASSTERAIALLEDNGWRKNNIGLLEKQIDGSTETLSISIRTSNSPLFNSVSEVVKRNWEAIGVEVVIEQYEQTGLVQSVIRPRDFQTLLFGVDMSRSQDLYPFWHSSQKDDPGLNIAQYTNLSVDALLETARTEQDEALRIAALTKASEIIEEERPAIFLFQPLMTYVVAENFIMPPLGGVARPSDRFNNTANWYTDSDELWSVFRY